MMATYFFNPPTQEQGLLRKTTRTYYAIVLFPFVGSSSSKEIKVPHSYLNGAIFFGSRKQYLNYMQGEKDIGKQISNQG